MIKELKNYLLNRSWTYLNEMIIYLFDDWNIVCNEFTVSKTLKHYDINRKKLQRVALKRFQVCRNEYMLFLMSLRDDQLCFLDEIANNEHILHRKSEWSVYEITSRVIRFVKRSKRFNLLFVYIKDDIFIYHIVQSDFNQILFEWFLKQKILSRCNPFPESRSILIMNNASIHHHRDVRSLCAKHDVRVLYFSFYFSDFNFIEKFFSMFKAHLKRYYNDVFVNESQFETVFRQAIEACSNSKTTKNHFSHANITIH